MTTTITTEEYERSQRHGYAGPLSDLQDSTRRRYEQVGADHWQIVSSHAGAALRPVRVVDLVWRVVCEDGVSRHGDPFGSRAEALYWAEWGHVCSSVDRHQFIETLDSRDYVRGTK